ncbi:MAG TPA: MlaD family protein [Anaerohalosphaeraceae bacterium]|nr:MCE family protein [Phycisphaerae bacterium]HOK95131.1 MlaD family protein [Anaerohalosphaeraceae bacterium]HOL31585.1 MlaD family protein [Anaerohalosphaeraceae bacterium]HOM75588.1 MlaD family protein [Anaerohalosphaeraceae bacterium]HPC63516.1 MlaD family protein [Anaerohalosphaeraceae bacterium]
MKQNSTYFKIGIFILGCTAILLGGLAWLSSSAFRGKPVLVETYLNESVQGLNIGSAVTHRGVKIGRVKTITLVALEYALKPDTPEYNAFHSYVAVIMEIDSRAFLGVDNNRLLVESLLDSKIKLGLRFKLSFQGITGLAYMEADYFDPQRSVPPDVPWKPKYIYVPSTASLFTSFTQAVERIYQRLEKMPIEGVLEKMQNTLSSMDQAVQEAEVGKISQSVTALAEDLRQTNRRLQDFLESAKSLPADFDSAILQLNSTLSHIEQLIDRNESDVEKLLINLNIVTQHLKQLAEKLNTDPAQFLLSKPRPPSEYIK